jgi:Ribbon-helix-helix protein, copG family
MQDKSKDTPEGKATPRLTLSLPPLQNEALNEMVLLTGLSKTELIRQAVALLNVAVRAKKKGLELSLANSDDEVVMKIASTV